MSTDSYGETSESAESSTQPTPAALQDNRQDISETTSRDRSQQTFLAGDLQGGINRSEDNSTHRTLYTGNVIHIHQYTRDELALPPNSIRTSTSSRASDAFKPSTSRESGAGTREDQQGTTLRSAKTERLQDSLNSLHGGRTPEPRLNTTSRPLASSLPEQSQQLGQQAISEKEQERPFDNNDDGGIYIEWIKSHKILLGTTFVFVCICIMVMHSSDSILGGQPPESRSASCFSGTHITIMVSCTSCNVVLPNYHLEPEGSRSISHIEQAFSITFSITSVIESSGKASSASLSSSTSHPTTKQTGTISESPTAVFYYYTTLSTFQSIETRVSTASPTPVSATAPPPITIAPKPPSEAGSYGPGSILVYDSGPVPSCFTCTYATFGMSCSENADNCCDPWMCIYSVCTAMVEYTVHWKGVSELPTFLPMH